MPGEPILIVDDNPANLKLARVLLCSEGYAVRGATDAQVNAATRKFVAPDRMVLVVIGDRAKVEPGLRELNLGEIILLDADGRPKTVTP